QRVISSGIAYSWEQELRWRIRRGPPFPPRWTIRAGAGSESRISSRLLLRWSRQDLEQGHGIQDGESRILGTETRILHEVEQVLIPRREIVRVCGEGEIEILPRHERSSSRSGFSLISRRFRVRLKPDLLSCRGNMARPTP